MTDEEILQAEEILESTQTTFNEDGLDVLVEDGTIENEEVANNGNENE